VNQERDERPLSLVVTAGRPGAVLP
jgi:hypothetical protein